MTAQHAAKHTTASIMDGVASARRTKARQSGRLGAVSADLHPISRISLAREVGAAPPLELHTGRPGPTHTPTRTYPRHYDTRDRHNSNRIFNPTTLEARPIARRHMSRPLTPDSMRYVHAPCVTTRAPDRRPSVSMHQHHAHGVCYIVHTDVRACTCSVSTSVT